MTSLLLRLAGPLQAWGDSSRFTTRSTRNAPTKSGVLGLVAAAQGRRRSDPLEDLVDLTFGVRVDQPGRLVRDFQTAQNARGESMPLSTRFYLADAVFVAALEGPRPLLEGIEEALRFPKYPLYLGRRSCVPTGTLLLGLRDGGVEDVLRTEPWHAAGWFREKQRVQFMSLEIFKDGAAADPDGETVRDVPVSFDTEHRQYAWRTVVQPEPVRISTGFAGGDEHDPFWW